MKVAMDSVGRPFVPKALRVELGITGPIELGVIGARRPVYPAVGVEVVYLIAY